MKKVFLLFGLFFLLVIGTVLGQNYLKNSNVLNSSDSKIPKAIINNQSFVLTIPDSNEEKQIGLSKTESLRDDEGMLFLFDNPDFYPFWMKDMKIPIDIIYIRDNKIVTIHENIQPPDDSAQELNIYTPSEVSDKVLEIKAGLSKKYDFKIGDEVKYENLGN
jgi:uncharacterized protein